MNGYSIKKRMKKKKYVSPTVRVYRIAPEGWIAITNRNIKNEDILVDDFGGTGDTNDPYAYDGDYTLFF
jgi:hypothetical protein